MAIKVKNLKTLNSAGTAFEKVAILDEADFTVTSGGWGGTNGAWTQTVNVGSSMTIDSATEGIVTIPQSATKAQYFAAVSAQLRCTGQDTNTITMTAYCWNKPTTDIPLHITCKYESANA